ncbi:MAG: L-aspartate oxidase [Flavobacteriales bacterium]|nr:L-aspartate oxidase [Flavobacteriales bacterium]|tara:strand:- start:8201 stop:9760 length:1560 start_codon:yes stop_codon:yes gene_type:complete
MDLKYDFLVVGGGIAGLSYSLKAAEKGKVCLITKDIPEETNTSYAQGGIAGVWNKEDHVDKHIADTLDAGAGLNKNKIVEIVVHEAKDRIKELIDWGTKFDKNRKGEYDLAKEGGHSESRILHYKDVTGKEIIRALLTQVNNHPNITVCDNYFALDIITQHHLGIKVTRKAEDIECFGAYVLDKNTNDILTVLAKNVIMASGGAGLVYKSTTNPLTATGDGVAMAYRAKAEVSDMEFIQFHPTSLYDPGAYPSFLISEAVRGFGAILRDHNGEEFMQKYDERESLAPRDIVARSIDNEMKLHGVDFVHLDCTHLNMKKFKAHFPNIYKKCVEIGIDPAFDYIPVVPAAHYSCGGIVVDEHGQSSVKNLFAIGECACTGLHGANRLASNSLLEAVVFAHRAYLKTSENITAKGYQTNIPDWDASGTEAPEEMILITQSMREVQGIMSAYVGIVRSDLRLKRALDRLEILYREVEELYEKTTPSQKLCETRNLINIAYLIIKFAANRKESVGLHYSLDYNQ